MIHCSHPHAQETSQLHVSVSVAEERLFREGHLNRSWAREEMLDDCYGVDVVAAGGEVETSNKIGRKKQVCWRGRGDGARTEGTIALFVSSLRNGQALLGSLYADSCLWITFPDLFVLTVGRSQSAALAKANDLFLRESSVEAEVRTSFTVPRP